MPFPEAYLPLESPVSDRPSAVVPGSAGSLLAVLIPRGSPATGEARHTIRRASVSLGRGADNDVVLADASVSEEHARLRLAGGVWLLRDLGSVNGSWVDGEPVHGELPLASGSSIRLGTAELVFSPHDRWEDSPPRSMPGREPEPDSGPMGFDLGLPERRALPPSLILGLVVAALALIGFLLIRAG